MMKKFSIILSPAVSHDESIARIKSMRHYMLYDNVFLVETDISTAKELYENIVGGSDINELMVILEFVNNSWGYASKDLWTWISENPKSEQES